MMGSFWDHVGVILKSCLGHVGAILPAPSVWVDTNTVPRQGKLPKQAPIACYQTHRSYGGGACGTHDATNGKNAAGLSALRPCLSSCRGPWARPCEGHGSKWAHQLGPTMRKAGTSQFQLKGTVTSSYQLVPVLTSCLTAGTSWYQLVRAGTN